jgi:hypothetical protein
MPKTVDKATGISQDSVHRILWEEEKNDTGGTPFNTSLPPPKKKLDIKQKQEYINLINVRFVGKLMNFMSLRISV